MNNVIGAIVAIKAPKRNPEVFINRKSEYAIILQAVCHTKLKFSDCFIGFPGSVSDTRVFRNSDLYQNVNRNINNYFPDEEFIVGDKAYPVLRWCLPPFFNRGNLTPSQQHYNNKVSQARQTIERAFALLFGRFRRLKFLDMNCEEFIPATVLAACVLHNICLHNKDPLLGEYIEEGRIAVRNNDNIAANVHFLEDRDIVGVNKRNEICLRLWEDRINNVRQ